MLQAGYTAIRRKRDPLGYVKGSALRRVSTSCGPRCPAGTVPWRKGPVEPGRLGPSVAEALGVSVSPRANRRLGGWFGRADTPRAQRHSWPAVPSAQGGWGRLTPEAHPAGTPSAGVTRWREQVKLPSFPIPKAGHRVRKHKPTAAGDRRQRGAIPLSSEQPCPRHRPARWPEGP